VGRVVDDEVHAREVLERANVAALPADDPALHVVGGKLDDGHRGLGGVARRDPLERVGHEIACAALRLGARLVLERPDAPGELVPRLLLPALEQQRPCLDLRQAGDPLELREVTALRLLELLLERADVLLPVCEPLIASRQLLELLLDLELLREHALLDLQHLRAPVGELRVDLASQPDCLLARVDLSLAPHRVAFAAGVLEQLIADPAGLRHPVVPKTDTASKARATPPAIPMAIPIPISTRTLLGR
jgi:hypothetical protein